MPLPAGSMEWPPKPLQTILPKIAEWSAWYSSSTDQLAQIYAGTGYRPGLLPANRPSQYRGGLVGSVARWFWGQPVASGQQRIKSHVPIASDIASTSADLLFSEELQLDLPDGTSRDRLDAILDGNSWQSLLLESAEIAAALTGVFLRVTWDQDVADHPLITAAHPDMAWPEFSFGRLRAVTFWQRVREDGQRVWRHLERHEPGRIEHGLYEGTLSDLGRRIPLTEDPGTASLTVDSDEGIVTGYPGLTAVYVPNIRPNRKWRSHTLGSNYGRSDFDGVEPLMDELDEIYTSWMRDIRLGKARILIPSNQLRSEGPGQAATFDMDQEVFTELATMPGSAKDASLQVSAQQFAIRYAEHQASAEDRLNRIYAGAGYSSQTFGMQGDVAITATEVGARERKSMTTREKKTRYWSHALADLIQAVTAVDQAIFHGGPMLRPTVVFPASVQPSLAEIGQSAQLLRSAQAASTETLVKMVHPDWDQKAIDEEVQKIMSEQALTVPDLGPLPGDEQPEPVTQDPADVKAKADAMGVLIRSGVDPQSAAAMVGLPQAQFTGAVPVSLRLPETDASDLEQQ